MNSPPLIAEKLMMLAIGFQADSVNVNVEYIIALWRFATILLLFQCSRTSEINSILEFPNQPALP